MDNNIFFPPLRRRPLEEYRNQRGNFYANYQENYDLIASDCLYRCVYCDSTVRDLGSDPLSLDHFRPKKRFAAKFDGILVIHPYNLYLSCQKCNVLKESDWKGCEDTLDGVTFNDRKGYIDRFQHDINHYMDMDRNGFLLSVHQDGPADYMINKLMLNRPGRVHIRASRLVSHRISKLESAIGNFTDQLIKKHESGTLEATDVLNIITDIRTIQKELDVIKSIA